MPSDIFKFEFVFEFELNLLLLCSPAGGNWEGAYLLCMLAGQCLPRDLLKFEFELSLSLS